MSVVADAAPPGMGFLARAASGAAWAAVVVVTALSALACGRAPDAPQVAVPGHEGSLKTTAALRASRRAYDGAPPVVPHEAFGVTCGECHGERGVEVPGLGFAPPMPHELTSGPGRFSRCAQCHVNRAADDEYVAGTFVGLRQDLRGGRRARAAAPPVMPHPVFMREQCLACHAGPAAREEIRTSHPERARCTQCHVERVTTAEFSPNAR